MNQPIDNTPRVPARPWSQIWLQALVKPSIKTYTEIAQDPNASADKAYVWVIAAIIVGFVILVVPTVLIGRASLGDILVRLPVIAIIAAVILTFSAGIPQVVAVGLGGKGTFQALAFASAAYMAPLGLIIYVLFTLLFYTTVTPFVVYLLPVIGIYGFVLNVIAIRAVHQIEWWKAVISALAVVIVVLAIAWIIDSILNNMAAEQGRVFSNIVKSL